MAQDPNEEQPQAPQTEQPEKGKRYRSWVGTLNNYTQADYDKMVGLHEQGVTTYQVIGKEVGANGTPHLQMHIELVNAKGLIGMKRNLHQRAHWQVRRGTPKQASTYCKKDGDFDEKGKLPMGSDEAGQKGWIKVKDYINNNPDVKYEDVQEKYTSYAGRYKNTIHEWIEMRDSKIAMANQKAIMDQQEPMTWQKTIMERFERQSDREILWLYDKKGKKGKSWLADYYETYKGAFISQGGANKDIAYMWDKQILNIFDLTRAKQEHIPYHLMEKMKDNRVASTKYMSVIKKAVARPKVMVFANSLPDWKVMSLDRWDVVQLKKCRSGRIKIEDIKPPSDLYEDDDVETEDDDDYMMQRIQEEEERGRQQQEDDDIAMTHMQLFDSVNMQNNYDI